MSEGAEEIAGGILEEARRLAAEKRAAAKETASRILKNAEAERGEKLKAEMERARARLEAEARKALSLTKLEAKKAFLAERERLMDEAFKRAVGLVEHDSGEYKAWMEKTIKKLSDALPGELFVLVVDPQDVSIAKSFFKGKIVEREIGGGAVAEGQHVVIDESLDSKISEIREKKRAEIARTIMLGNNK